MPYLAHNAAQIYYEFLGDNGPVLTFVCGITRSMEDFRVYSRRLTESGFRVLLLDNRGAGKTIWQPEFSLKDMASDIVAVWDHLGCDKSILIGFSLGGIVALETAISYRHRVKALIVISSSIYSEYLNREVLLDKQTSDETIEENIPRYFSKKYRDKHLLFVSAFAKKLIREHYKSEVQRGAIAQRKALEGNSVEQNVSTLSLPVLLVHGIEDEVVSVESSRKANQEIKNSKLVEIKEAGHMLLVEEPEQLFQTIKTYLSSLAVQ